MALEAAQARPQDDFANDYESFSAALSDSARGRAFLAEYAKRNRTADTEILLAALTRLEGTVRADRGALDKLRSELRMLLIAIRLTRPEIDAVNPQGKAEKLAGLLEMLEARIDMIVETRHDDIKPPEETPAPAPAVLAAVPRPDEPELPIPQPANDQSQAIGLVRMPEITFVEKMAVAQVVEKVMEQAAVPAAPAAAAPVFEAIVFEKAAPVARSAAALPPVDPLAPIMAMSEAERIALFS